MFSSTISDSRSPGASASAVSPGPAPVPYFDCLLASLPPFLARLLDDSSLSELSSRIIGSQSSLDQRYFNAFVWREDSHWHRHDQLHNAANNAHPNDSSDSDDDQHWSSSSESDENEADRQPTEAGPRRPAHDFDDQPSEQIPDAALAAEPQLKLATRKPRTRKLHQHANQILTRYYFEEWLPRKRQEKQNKSFAASGHESQHPNGSDVKWISSAPWYKLHLSVIPAVNVLRYFQNRDARHQKRVEIRRRTQMYLFNRIKAESLKLPPKLMRAAVAAAFPPLDMHVEKIASASSSQQREIVEKLKSQKQPKKGWKEKSVGTSSVARMKEKVASERAASQNKASSNKLQSTIAMLNNTNLSLLDRIISLEAKLNDFKHIDATSALEGYLTIVAWRVELILKDGPINTKAALQASATQLAALLSSIFDIYRRFNDCLGPRAVRRLNDILDWIGFADASDRMQRWFDAHSKVRVQTGAALIDDCNVDRPIDSLPITPHNKPFIAATMSPVRFQLLYCGPYQLRHADGVEDSRVCFMPDRWQVAVLDCIDRHESALLICPTSAGKTMISLYAMNRAHQLRNEQKQFPARVVYVCPTQALANQTAAELQNSEIGSVEIFTREQKPNREQFDVLITVPATLEILFSAPTAQAWLKTIWYIVFDEVHLINSPEEGKRWERLLLACPCPYIACSATLGDPRGLHTWMQSFSKTRVHYIGESASRQAVSVELNRDSDSGNDAGFQIHRWAHLDTNVFVDGTINAVNPFACVSDELVRDFHRAQTLKHCDTLDKDNSTQNNREHTSADSLDFLRLLELSSSDCLEIYDALHYAAQKQVDTTQKSDNELLRSAIARFQVSIRVLDPEQYFSAVCSITRSSTRAWKQDLIQLFLELLQWPDPEALAQLSDRTFEGNDISSIRDSMLEIAMSTLKRLRCQASSAPVFAPHTKLASIQHHTSASQLLVLVQELKRRQWLPGIVFRLDQASIEHSCHDMLLLLEREEMNYLYHHDRPRFLKKQDAFVELERSRIARVPILNRIRSVQSEMQQLKQDSKAYRTCEKQLESLENELSQLNDDWNEPLPQFSFGSNPLKRIQNEEFWEDRIPLEERDPRSVWFRMIRRGFSYHHAALTRAQKGYVEALFRAGKLGLVLATNTLAMGINAPARSVVFWGDSPYLDPILFHQMRGRAGRRGWDVEGHVILAGIPLERIQTLLIEPLPAIEKPSGLLLPSSISLVYMQMLWQTRWESVSHQREVLGSVRQFFTHSMRQRKNNSQSNQLIQSDGPEPLTRLLRCHFLCSYSLFRSLDLLTSDGAPYCCAGLVHHLSYLGPPSILLAHLFQTGFVAQYCQLNARNSSHSERLAIQLISYFVKPIVVNVKGSQRLVQWSDEMQRAVQSFNRTVQSHFAPLIEIPQYSVLAEHDGSSSIADRWIPTIDFPSEAADDERFLKISSYAVQFFLSGQYNQLLNDGHRDSELYNAIEEMHFVLKKIVIVMERLRNNASNALENGTHKQQKLQAEGIQKFVKTMQLFQVCKLFRSVSDQFSAHFNCVRKRKTPFH